jgi:hypothetical protein
MPKPSLSASVTTTAATEVELSPKLKLQLKAKLEEFADLRVQKKSIEQREEDIKLEIETLFADAGEYNALLEGVRVDTSYGPVPVKVVTGGTSKKFDKKLLMKQHKLTIAQVDALYKTTPKADYVNVSLPRDKDSKEEEE